MFVPKFLISYLLAAKELALKRFVRWFLVDIEVAATVVEEQAFADAEAYATHLDQTGRPELAKMLRAKIAELKSDSLDIAAFQQEKSAKVLEEPQAPSSVPPKKRGRPKVLVSQPKEGENNGTHAEAN